jgi:hypothetical protein
MPLTQFLDESKRLEIKYDAIIKANKHSLIMLAEQIRITNEINKKCELIISQLEAANS